MFKMLPENDEDPPSTNGPDISGAAIRSESKNSQNGNQSLMKRVKSLFGHNGGRNDNALREAIEEYIEESPDRDADEVSSHERLLFSNILDLRDIKVCDVMIPRADIAAIDVDTTKDDLLKFMAEKQYSRFPVYRDTLDDVLGTVHLKDIITAMAEGRKIRLKDFLTDIPIVSPSMPVLDLLLEMRKTRRHIALVVDEYGGIDGLVTIGDVMETIIGEIDDEHDREDAPQIIEEADGSILADARLDIEAFEDRYGAILSEEEREESDTLGGLVFAMAGRVPARGEVLTHTTGMIFEVLEADPRKISRLRIRDIPQASNDS
ncbi:MAG: HlyC/CorC family transporter [Alphaproteobacteria bacterium]|nr:HlyC/CorC family transporter [Alphaproteobacteria bacterium]